ncbi:MAG: hypothetical protein BWK73_49140 [Thiothrix lacustris]|uniref:Trypsin-co-occurring domain-containing protein n=1 Tax=Thiothrix lacustris TaxID=525917 RepID=A0A1Y1Q9A2_9GAMM|nr:MAG: hypothetical protein BWK73_49140 [Thiothrix lacustris]
MTKHLIEYPLDNGDIIYIEAETTEDELSRISNDGGKETSGQKFEDALKKTEPALSAVANLIKRLNPAEAQVEVGFKFSAKAGVILASADSEATFKVTLKWKTNA